MEERVAFYERVVDSLIKPKTASILICGGGMLDRIVFDKLGFSKVTLSNLDTRIKPIDYEPFEWKYENAEALSFADNSFDYVVIHAAIHHASLPHKVLCEMYRVARIGVLGIENRDSVTLRIFERLSLTQMYEHAAVYFNDCQYGGLNNTDIPNFVYRWTERELEKTIQTYAPLFQHKYIYTYGTAFPCTPKLESRGRIKTIFLKVLRPAYQIFVKFFPKQQNLFAFYIDKSNPEQELFPWLIQDENGNIRFNEKWGQQKYGQKSSSLI
ncbi:class I SAM-dependent methyltransferase [Polynucleobacter necessarius]|uniref:class I SAM-dependent methyltransferase n=1 Tax=Polynucleobacter necessarius TaxID=576610 RepID=UPI000E09DF53|nr:methyltransferase domain-containing protein [Polynucleobacter necessarius]HAT39080.1 hypothetical protein [Polynucleobacter sp.]